MIKLILTILMSQFTNAKMLNPHIEGKIQSFDLETVTIHSDFYKIEVPRRMVAQESLKAGNFIRVTLPDGKLSEVAKSIDVSYRVNSR